MRILSLSLGLAAIACVTVQAFDPLAASNPSQQYAWTAEKAQDDLAFQAEELSDSISELEFRAQILSRMQEYTDEDQSKFQANDTPTCDGAKKIVMEAIAAAKGAVSLIPVPLVGGQFSFVSAILDAANAVVAGTLNLGNSASFVSISLALTVAKSVVSSLAVGPLAPILIPVVAILNSAQSTTNSLVKCVTGASKIAIEQAHCNDLANMYRVAVAESTKTSPALNLPADASDDLKRFAAGSLAVLDLMQKSSIASTNDALLASRPIFATNVLEQYRNELLRVATTDEMKAYAQTGLAAVIGVSNALEACLRVAADPVGAIDELNEELEARAIEDEDEDEDEEEEDEETEA